MVRKLDVWILLEFTSVIFTEVRFYLSVHMRGNNIRNLENPLARGNFRVSNVITHKT